MIERQRPGETYYLFPGGQVEEGESDLEALVRECREELGLEVVPGLLVAEVTYNGRTQRFYPATVIGGAFGTGAGPEFAAQSEEARFTPVWVPLTEVSDRNAHPRAVVDLVAAGAGSWPAGVVYAVDAGRSQRRGDRAQP